jgi:hypothetical protein
MKHHIIKTGRSFLGVILLCVGTLPFIGCSDKENQDTVSDMPTYKATQPIEFEISTNTENLFSILLAQDGKIVGKPKLIKPSSNPEEDQNFIANSPTYGQHFSDVTKAADFAINLSKQPGVTDISIRRVYKDGQPTGGEEYIALWKEEV